MQLTTSIIYKAMKPRLLAIKQYDHDAINIQQRQLKRVLRQLNGCQYGQALGSPIKNYDEWSQRVPVVEYQDIRPSVEQMLNGERNILNRGKCQWFATSSGTNDGRSKNLPVSGLHLQASHFKGASDTLWLYLNTRPDSQFFAHKSLVIGGSHHPSELAPGIHSGDLSAILIENMPALGQMARVPSKKTLLMDEWTEKMKSIINEVRHADVGSLSGVPSWMLEMITAVMQAEGADNLSQVWPNLEVFFHGGVGFDPYRERYNQLIPSDRMQYRETYNASEGFFAIQNDPDDRAMLLMLDYGVFYEFIPIEQLDQPDAAVVPLEGVEIGQTYAMLISTLGGLYRYQIGDTVKFTSTNPYKIVIAGRTKHYINLFGEELMVYNATTAIERVSAQLNCHVKEFTAAPYFNPDKAKGRHDWIIEFDSMPESIEQFADMLDTELRQLNSDYDAKRYADMTLERLSLTVAPEGLFRRWFEVKGKLGGQNKMPHLKNDRTLYDELIALTQQ